MIKFFRKIRQKLLSENKISKYLLYALGEIVLIVIGILLALQVNNWNENKTIQRRIDDRLSNLAREIEDDIQEMYEVLKSSAGRIIITDSILKGSNRYGSFHMNKPLLHNSIEEYKNPNSILTSLRVFDGNISTYNELLNSGEFHLIQDDSVAKKIQKYYSGLNELKNREYQNNIQSRNRLVKSKSRLGIGTFSSTSTLKQLIELAIKDQQFGAELENEYYLSCIQHKEIEKKLQEAKDLIRVIEAR